MDAAELLARLRLLSQARPGPGILELPPGLSGADAVAAVRGALKALAPENTPCMKPGHRRRAARAHIDGASRGNPGPAGVGVMIVGPDGQVAERMHRYIGEATNNVAEYRALLLALERAHALGYTVLEICSDSELLVRQLQGRYRVNHPTLRELHARATERLGHFHRLDIHHVPREQNAEADALANRAIDEACRPGRPVVE